jgi:hypothetical protein
MMSAMGRKRDTATILRSFEAFHFIGWLEIAHPKKAADGLRSAATASIDKGDPAGFACERSAAWTRQSGRIFRAGLESDQRGHDDEHREEHGHRRNDAPHFPVAVPHRHLGRATAWKARARV